MEGGKAYRIRRAKESPRGPLLSPCVAVVFVSFGPPSQWERGTIGSPTTATESRGSRAILACSPESFWRPYFVNEPQTRGAAARPNTGRGRCPLSENLFRYMKKNKQQIFAVFCTLSGGQARKGKTISEIFNFAPCRAVKPERVKKDLFVYWLHIFKQVRQNDFRVPEILCRLQSFKIGREIVAQLRTLHPLERVEIPTLNAVNLAALP